MGAQKTNSSVKSLASVSSRDQVLGEKTMQRQFAMKEQMAKLEKLEN